MHLGKGVHLDESHPGGLESAEDDGEESVGQLVPCPDLPRTSCGRHGRRARRRRAVLGSRHRTATGTAGTARTSRAPHCRRSDQRHRLVGSGRAIGHRLDAQPHRAQRPRPRRRAAHAMSLLAYLPVVDNREAMDSTAITALIASTTPPPAVRHGASQRRRSQCCDQDNP